MKETLNRTKQTEQVFVGKADNQNKATRKKDDIKKKEQEMKLESVRSNKTTQRKSNIQKSEKSEKIKEVKPKNNEKQTNKEIIVKNDLK